MMTTPIYDFVKKYIESDSLRLHMPGHKGKGLLGFENMDITEISGADSLYEAKDIIKKSEENASKIFGANTFYSTEGSSLSIRAMIYLYMLWAGRDGKIIAARNVHKAFISAVALLDVRVEWISSKDSYLSNKIDLDELEKSLENSKNAAVYITSPDYLGNMVDIKAISEICKKHGAKLLIDNAHGAYLKFLPQSLHPIDLGADMCCDSAHKTLPVLTGGAYLHISKENQFFADKAKDALSLFGSTSPSYLILQSLDLANKYIDDGYGLRLYDFYKSLTNTAKAIKQLGFDIIHSEPLKLTFMPKGYGYYGFELAEHLENHNIYVEFSDRDYLVLMLTPENGLFEEILLSALKALPKKETIKEEIPIMTLPKRALSPRESLFAETEIINSDKSEGRIFGGFNISCPPAVPIIVCGEIINNKALECFKYYGIEKCRVVKEEY